MKTSALRVRGKGPMRALEKLQSGTFCDGVTLTQHDLNTLVFAIRALERKLRRRKA